MNENRSITIVISPTGEAKVETHSYIGSSCQEASKFIEQALGQTTAEQFKPTFYQTVTNLEQEYETP